MTNTVAKKEKNFAEVDIEQATFYACEDADVTLQLWQLLYKKLIANKLMFVYKNIEVPLIKIISEMENNGVFVDQEKLKEIYNEFLKIRGDDFFNIESLILE